MASLTPVLIPLRPNSKRPCAFQWNKIKATPNKLSFKNKNYGLLCGAKSNVWVLDVDTKDHGMDTWNTLTEKHGKPKTPYQSTPSGGLHYLFQHAPGYKNARKINGVGIDIRTEGGYIAFSPSVIDGKSYEIHGDLNQLASLDDYPWLIEWLNTEQETPVKKPCDEKQSTIIVRKESFNVRTEDVVKTLKKLAKTHRDDYNKWFKVASACKSEGEYLWGVFDEWSKGSPKYDADNNHKIWDGIVPIVDINYLCHLAGEKPKFVPFRKYVAVSMKRPDTIMSQYIDPKLYFNKPTFILKSSTGTGKTTSFCRYFKQLNEDTQLLSITSRMCLATTHTEKFREESLDAWNYQRCTRCNMTEAPQYFCVQVDSIAKFEYPELHNTVVYLDEVDSLVSYVVQSDTLNNKRRAVFTQLCHILKNAKQVVATDADVSDKTLAFLTKLRNDDVYFIENEYQNCGGIEAIEYAEKERIVDKMKQCVKNRQPFLACFDTKRWAESFHKILKDHDQSQEESFILHTAEENGDVSNVETLWKDKYVFYSPKIVYGVDFVPETKQPVFVLSKGQTITPLNIVQQMARTRNIESVHYYFSSEAKRWPQFNSVQSIKTYLDHNKFDNMDLFSQMGAWDDAKDTIREDHLFTELYSLVMYERDTFNCDQKRHFQDILKKKGFVMVQDKTKTEPVDKIDLKKIKDEVINEKIKKVDAYIQTGYMEDKTFIEVVEKRFELVNATNPHDKEKCAAFVADGDGFDKLLTLTSIGVADYKKLADKTTMMVEGDFSETVCESKLMTIRHCREIRKKLGLKPFEAREELTRELLGIKMDDKDPEWKLYERICNRHLRVRSVNSGWKTHYDAYNAVCRMESQLFGFGSPDSQPVCCTFVCRSERIKGCENRDKRVRTYETQWGNMREAMEILRLRNPSLKGVDDTIIEMVYEDTKENVVRPKYGFREAEEEDDEEETGNNYDSDADEWN